MVPFTKFVSNLISCLRECLECKDTNQAINFNQDDKSVAFYVFQLLLWQRWCCLYDLVISFHVLQQHNNKCTPQHTLLLRNQGRRPEQRVVLIWLPLWQLLGISQHRQLSGKQLASVYLRLSNNKVGQYLDGCCSSSPYYVGYKPNADAEKQLNIGSHYIQFRSMNVHLRLIKATIRVVCKVISVQIPTTFDVEVCMFCG